MPKEIWTEIYNHCFNEKARILLSVIIGSPVLCWLLLTRIGDGSWFEFCGAIPRSCLCLNGPCPRKGGEVVNTTKNTERRRKLHVVFVIFQKIPLSRESGGRERTGHAGKTLQSPASGEQERNTGSAKSRSENVLWVAEWMDG